MHSLVNHVKRTLTDTPKMMLVLSRYKTVFTATLGRGTAEVFLGTSKNIISQKFVPIMLAGSAK